MRFHLRRRRPWPALGAVALAVAVVAGALVWFLKPGPDTAFRAPEPVSHVDTATRTCFLSSVDADPTGTWERLRETAEASGSHLVVQRYQLPAGADPVAYVNTLVQLRCSTVVATGSAARSAVASRLADGPVPNVRFEVVDERRPRGATREAASTPGSPSAGSAG
ncbi:hypothetical protein [Streptomyces sp. NBC_00102]|uniref:hypothetical protein n=1 Tax=Streptomyces sp. NBC_00102 TaxID=2975652 RepID=UPI002254B662|nr:hypothetical protein [Streptomyces sp. NBC_00102]MCX5395801.1 hypothetical protein [Streptomyces sp. NBC_00102]